MYFIATLESSLRISETLMHKNIFSLCLPLPLPIPLSLSLSLRCMQPLLMEPHWLLNIIPLLGEMKLENSVNISDVDRTQQGWTEDDLSVEALASFFFIQVL